METIWKVRFIPGGIKSRKEICPECGKGLLIKPHRIEYNEERESFMLFYSIYCPKCNFKKEGRAEIYEEELKFEYE